MDIEAGQAGMFQKQSETQLEPLRWCGQQRLSERSLFARFPKLRDSSTQFPAEE
jgi:hypothetical protein